MQQITPYILGIGPIVIGGIILFLFKRWIKQRDAERSKLQRSLFMLNVQLQCINKGIFASLNGQAKVYQESYDEEFDRLLKKYELNKSEMEL